MEIRIKFQGGDYDGQTALTDGLDELKIFFLNPDKRALVYRRFNEVEYVFSQDMSVRITDHFDSAQIYYAVREPSSLRFEEDAGPIEPIEFSDTPIEDEDGGTK